MKVSLRQTRNNRQGKLSKVSRPGLRDINRNFIAIVLRLCVIDPKFQPKSDTYQKIDLNISSKGVAVLGKKSS